MSDDQKVMTDLVNIKVVPYIESEGIQVDILLILQIVAALIALFKECKSLKTDSVGDLPRILKVVNNPSLFNKARLYFAIRRQCKRNGTKEYLDTIVDALIKAGKQATLQDVQTIWQVSSQV